MGSQPNATSDRLLTTMFLVVMVALGGPAFIGTAASDGSPWDWFLLTVWVCTVLGAAWSTRRAWRTRRTPDAALPDVDVTATDVDQAVYGHNRLNAVKALRETYPALGLTDAVHLVDAVREANGIGANSTEKRQQSTNWLRMVWISSLFLATLAGGYVGAVTSTTIVGAIVGAMMAVPAGAIAALIIVGTGALFLRASGDGERRVSRHRWFRVVFSAYVSAVIGMLLFIVFFVLAGGDSAQVPYVAVVCLTGLVAAMGFCFPPK